MRPPLRLLLVLLVFAFVTSLPLSPPVVAASECGTHNLQCYTGYNACAAECCGVCERRINCGGPSAHKCFE